MFKKPIFLFIATFILAGSLAFFASYFVAQGFLIQKVQSQTVNIGNNLDMGNTYKITNVSAASSDNEAVTFTQFNEWGELWLPCGPTDTCSTGKVCKVDSWCALNDFSFCTNQDDFPPYNETPPSCFTAQTPILMADGRYKNIGDVQAGEYVLTRESEDSPKLVKAKVLEVYEHWVNRYLIINDSLEVTRYHRMFVNGEWKVAGEIKLGDKLLNKDNKEVMVESIEEVAKKENFKVYNLEIEKYKTYFANGFYVHNRKPVQE